MFTKCKQLSRFFTASLAEDVADLFYEMGKDMLSKRDYEATTRWLERAHDVLGEQSLETLSAEAGELRLSIVQSIGMSVRMPFLTATHERIVQAYMKLKSPEAHTKAWRMLQLLETVGPLYHILAIVLMISRAKRTKCLYLYLSSNCCTLKPQLILNRYIRVSTFV